MGINLSNGPLFDECEERPEGCKEKHTIRVANATLEIAIDVHTDFDCKPEK